MELKLYKQDFDTVSWDILCRKCGISPTYSEIIIGANYIESNNYDDFSELLDQLKNYNLPQELHDSEKEIMWNNYGSYQDDEWIWAEKTTMLVYGVRRQDIIDIIHKLEVYYKDLENQNAEV